MEKNEIVILALIVVVIALLVVMASMAAEKNAPKHYTMLTFESNSTLTEGDLLEIKLENTNKTGLANQTVNVTMVKNSNSTDHQYILTDDNGTGTLRMDNGSGTYNITISYGGNDEYRQCNSTKTIMIKEKVVKSQSKSSSNATNRTSPQGKYGFWTSLGNYIDEKSDSLGNYIDDKSRSFNSQIP
jgi:hypothetical protein